MSHPAPGTERPGPSAGSPSACAASGPVVLTRKTLVYRLCHRLTWLFYLLWFRRRVEGREHLGAQGGVLLAVNHQSFLDIPLVSSATSRHVCFVARESLARSKVLGFIMRQCGAVLIQRGVPDRVAVREMVAHLEAGDCLAIFPEGTRSADGRLGELRGGALLAARKAGVPIVPAGIRGALEALPRGASWPRPKRVALRFGPAFDPARPDALEHLRAELERLVGAGRFDSLPPAP